MRYWRISCRIGKSAVFFAWALLFSMAASAAVGGEEKEKKVGAGKLSPVAMSIFKERASPTELAKKANRGDSHAALVLGYMYRLGHKVKKDPVKAVEWFRKAADRGNAEGQLQMAVMYAAGQGVAPDYDAMRHWLRKSAENGYGLSQFQLGLLYAKGITVDQDMGVARMWLGFAAEQPGEVGQMAKTVLADLRREASAAGMDFIAMPAWVNVAEKYGRALANLQAGAEKGDVRSQYRLGLVFNWLGSGDEVNPMNVFYQEAARFFRRAAEQNNPSAQYGLGELYFAGRGVVGNAKEAVLWMGRAAKQDYVPAQAALGAWYDDRHADHDSVQAKMWYERAHSKGDWSAKARFMEEDIISSAPGERNRPIRQWDVRDQYVMALAYEKGTGVPTDQEQAVAWYRMAASGLLVPAQRRLGLAYLKGWGVAQDDAEAAVWLDLAAEQGDAEAQIALAGMFVDGRGVPRDEKHAFSLYEKAALAGVTEAQERLGMLYRDGRGVKKNTDEAIKWLERAAFRSGTAAGQMLALLQEEPEA